MKADFQMPEREERLQGPDLVRLDYPDGTDDVRLVTNNNHITMKKGLFFPCLLAATISFLLFHSCNDDDKISQPMEEVDPLLDTSVSPDFCHAILIIGVDEDYTSARIIEDSLNFDYIFSRRVILRASVFHHKTPFLSGFFLQEDLTNTFPFPKMPLRGAVIYPFVNNSTNNQFYIHESQSFVYNYCKLLCHTLG